MTHGKDYVLNGTAVIGAGVPRVLSNISLISIDNALHTCHE